MNGWTGTYAEDFDFANEPDAGAVDVAIVRDDLDGDGARRCGL